MMFNSVKLRIDIHPPVKNANNLDSSVGPRKND
jgi:hypothetical protein